MELSLKGKYALVTGGSHGIGKAIALSLAKEGCNVAICARNLERLNEAVKEIKRKKSKVLGIQADVTIAQDIDRVMKLIVDSWAGLDILINNVGGGGRWGDPDVGKTDEQVWIDVYNKNTLSAIRFTMKALALMKKRGWGRVVTIASIYGYEAGGRPWFNMAKAAEISLMKTLAKDKSLSRRGITFNSIVPGSIMIPDTGWEREKKNNLKAFKEKIDKEFPLGRLGTPEEVAEVVTFICSKKAVLVNGAAILVDGAQSCSF